MEYPVTLMDGHTYEREGIKKWLNQKKLIVAHDNVINGVRTG